MDFSVAEGCIEHVKYWYTQDWRVFKFPGCNNNDDELIRDFELLDTEKYPSISYAPKADFLVRRNCENLDDLNDQKVEARLQNSDIFENFGNIDQGVFDLPKSRFISSISIDDEEDEENGDKGTVEELELESKDGSRYTVRKSTGNNSLAILPDYAESL